MRQPVPFGKYLLLDRISVGGMAEVFKAKSYGVEGFEKIIAIKRILPTMGEDRDFIKMFIDEAKIAGQLAHANICQIFELGRIDGSHFIAMEYIWGKDLLQIQNRLRKLKQPMPVPMACFIIAKVLEGLDYAHRKRDPLGRPLEIVHRDCSPQNVLVSYEGEVKVIDFGIAKATSRNSRTMAGVLKGKFGYMSPEQVRGLPLDRRSDIFALGTMMYECLTSDRLFQGETDFSTLEKVRNVDIQPPRAVNPNIPEVVEKVILKALAKDVDDRYQWCSEMLVDLQAFLMSQDVVFTAKSLSGWLKEVFTQEIERERSQLEQYKRVGRDGLIAGVPAAAAKLDVVATLGEAGMPEGDATQLGGPNFDDIENILQAGAQPSIGPAAGSPAATGRPAVGPRAQSPAAGAGAPRKAAAPPAKAAAPASNDGEDDDGDDGFGEEAPTEIFGEIDEKPPGVATPAAGSPAGGRTPAPSGIKPPAKPAPRPATNQPYASPQPMAAQPANPSASAKTMMQPGGLAAMTGAGNTPAPVPVTPSDGFVAASASPAAGFQSQSYIGPGVAANASPAYPQPQYPSPAGTPTAMPNAAPLDAPGNPNMGSQAKTVLGMSAPPGLGNYGGGYVPPNSTANPGGPQGPAPMGPGGYPQQQQPDPYHNGGYPTAPASGGYPGYPSYNDPYSSQPYGSGQQAGYGYGAPTNALDPNAPANEGKKKSSIGRDVAIGVGIAALVLGGFLAVKFLVLDADQGAPAEPVASGSQTAQIATIEIAMPDGITAEFFVDEKRIATVENGRKLPVTAGLRKIKLLAPNGSRCEQPIELPAGETKTVQCIMFTGTTGSGSGSAATAVDSGSAAGSGSAAAGSGSAATMAGSAAGSAAAGSGSAAGSASGSGSAAVPKADPAKEKAAAEKAARLAAERAERAEKAAEEKAEKAAAEKAAAEKARQDKLKADRLKAGSGSTGTRPPIEAKPPASTKGFLTVTSKPVGAKIAIDNVDTGMVTPITKGIALTPGKHKVTFTIGSDRHTFSVNITAGQTQSLSKELK